MAVEPLKALELIINHTKQTSTETIKIEDASGRICAKDVEATLPLPRFNNSAMDGYAINFEDRGKTVNVLGKTFAGDVAMFSLESLKAVKVMTGAPIPSNTSAIVPQEFVTVVDDNTIALPNDIKQFQNMRYVGEDIDIGENIIRKHQELHFGVVSLLASQGITEIEVYRKPRVAIFASGEEIRPHTESIEPHQIYNSNSPSLIARCKELGCEVEFMGSAKDTVESLVDHINRSLEYDLIVTSGGVSVGDKDFTKEAFNNFDFEKIFDGIIVKPGKPTVFGKINDTMVLNLPGNPFASQIIFEIFGTPLVQRLRGSHCANHKILQAKLKTKVNNKKGRMTLVPGNFDGEYFDTTLKKKPGMVSVLAHANALLALDSDVEVLEEGSIVNAIKISHKGFTSNKKDFITYG